MAGAGSVPASSFDNLPCLLDDLDYYLETYQSYAEFSGLKLDIYKNWARTIFDEQVVGHLAEKFGGENDSGLVLRVLAVGSGDGKIDSCMLERLVPKFPRIEYTVIEPANDPLAEFKSLVADRGEEFSGVEFIWRNETFDEFREQMESKSQGGIIEERYHLVHAVHSLYYANDLYQAQTFLRNSLVKCGVMLAILLSDEAGIYRVWDRYPRLVEGSPAHNLCSAHLREILESEATPYQFYRQMWRSDISACFDPASAKGNKMLDFVSHVKHFRQSAPEDLRSDFLEFLSALNRVDKEDPESSGGYPRDWDSIVIIKS